MTGGGLAEAMPARASPVTTRSPKRSTMRRRESVMTLNLAPDRMAHREALGRLEREADRRERRANPPRPYDTRARGREEEPALEDAVPVRADSPHRHPPP